jgi:hypothetical protein
MFSLLAIGALSVHGRARTQAAPRHSLKKLALNLLEGGVLRLLHHMSPSGLMGLANGGCQKRIQPELSLCVHRRGRQRTLLEHRNGALRGRHEGLGACGDQVEERVALANQERLVGFLALHSSRNRRATEIRRGRVNGQRSLGPKRQSHRGIVQNVCKVARRDVLVRRSRLEGRHGVRTRNVLQILGAVQI